jgi:alcohol dehydrogenase
MELSTDQQSIVFADGALTELAPMLDSLQARRVFFVVDSTAYAASAASGQLQETLEARDTFYFRDFEINPQISDVERGIESFNAESYDVIVAFGGGTAIDLAKMIRGLSCCGADLHNLIDGSAPIVPNDTPLIAIPTTAGTGSEATHFAVVYRNGSKFSVADPSFLPNRVILDPTLTYSMPPWVTAASGLDALCQAIESMWAVGATEESVDCASHAIKLALENLPAAVNSPDPKSRRAMCLAAHLAGKAINISKTTAPHAISYWLTTRYGIPHGAAVAVTLPRILEYNSRLSEVDCMDPRGPEHVRSRFGRILSLLDVNDVAEARQKLEQLIALVECPVSLYDLGIVDEEAVLELAARVSAERLANNPRQIPNGRLVELLVDSAATRETAVPQPHFTKPARKLLHETN